MDEALEHAIGQGNVDNIVGEKGGVVNIDSVVAEMRRSAVQPAEPPNPATAAGESKTTIQTADRKQVLNRIAE